MCTKVSWKWKVLHNLVHHNVVYDILDDLFSSSPDNHSRLAEFPSCFISFLLHVLLHYFPKYSVWSFMVPSTQHFHLQHRFSNINSTSVNYQTTNSSNLSVTLVSSFLILAFLVKIFTTSPLLTFRHLQDLQSIQNGMSHDFPSCFNKTLINFYSVKALGASVYPPKIRSDLKAP